MFYVQLTYHIYNTRFIFNNYFVLISKRNSQQMFKISSIYNNLRVDTSDHGLSHPIKGAGAAVNGLTGIKKNTLLNCLSILSWN